MDSPTLGSQLASARVDGQFASLEGNDIRLCLEDGSKHPALLAILQNTRGVVLTPLTANGRVRASSFNILHPGMAGTLAYLRGGRGHTDRVVQDGLVIRAMFRNEVLFFIFHVIWTRIPEVRLKRRVYLTVLTGGLNDWPAILQKGHHDITRNNLTPAIAATLNVIRRRRHDVNIANRNIQTNDLTGIGYARTMRCILATNSQEDLDDFIETEAFLYAMSEDEMQTFARKVYGTMQLQIQDPELVVPVINQQDALDRDFDAALAADFDDLFHGDDLGIMDEVIPAISQQDALNLDFEAALAADFDDLFQFDGDDLGIMDEVIPAISQRDAPDVADFDAALAVDDDDLEVMDEDVPAIWQQQDALDVDAADDLYQFANDDLEHMDVIFQTEIAVLPAHDMSLLMDFSL